MSQELSSLRSNFSRPSTSSRNCSKHASQEAAPPRLALHPAAKMWQVQLPLQPRGAPREHRAVLSRPRTAAEHLATTRATRIATIMTHDYRRCRQNRAQLVRWHRQLLKLVDALRPLASKRAKPCSQIVCVLVAEEAASFQQELTDGSRRLREQQAVGDR